MGTVVNQFVLVHRQNHWSRRTAIGWKSWFWLNGLQFDGSEWIKSFQFSASLRLSRGCCCCPTSVSLFSSSDEEGIGAFKLTCAWQDQIYRVEDKLAGNKNTWLRIPSRLFLQNVIVLVIAPILSLASYSSVPVCALNSAKLFFSYILQCALNSAKLTFWKENRIG